MPALHLFQRLGRCLGRAVAMAAVGSGVVSCGQSDTVLGDSIGATEQPIIGGHLDRATSGVVAIVLPEPPLVEFCSGTLLAPNLVLTARHCVSVVKGTDSGQIQCGVSQFQAPHAGNQFYVSPDAVRPNTLDDPSFVQGADVRVPTDSPDFCGNDVALLILAGKGISSKSATPIVPRIDLTPPPGEEFAAEGFGLTEPNSKDSDGTRMRVDGDTVRCAGVDCRTQSEDIGATEWLSMDAQICPGDSGGPALDSEGRTLGVASRGADGCSTAVYGDVASWKDFIVSTAKDAARLGGYDVPFWAATGSSTRGAPAAEQVHADPGTPANPLGDSCSGSCGNGYACYSDTAEPPGICVPYCSSSAPQCPSQYACATSLSVCVPEGSPALPHRSSGGCSTSSFDGPHGVGVAAALTTVLVAARRRRRRARRPR